MLHAVGGAGTRAGEPRGVVMTEHPDDGPHVAQHICQDHHERCPLWAAHGECQANPKYMRGCPLPPPLPDLSSFSTLRPFCVGNSAQACSQSSRCWLDAVVCDVCGNERDVISASQGIGTSQRHLHLPAASKQHQPCPGRGGRRGAGRTSGPGTAGPPAETAACPPTSRTGACRSAPPGGCWGPQPASPPNWRTGEPPQPLQT